MSQRCVHSNIFLDVKQKCSLIQMSLCSLASELCVHSCCSVCSFHSSVHATFMKLNKRCGTLYKLTPVLLAVQSSWKQYEGMTHNNCFPAFLFQLNQTFWSWLGFPLVAPVHLLTGLHLFYSFVVCEWFNNYITFSKGANSHLGFCKVSIIITWFKVGLNESRLDHFNHGSLTILNRNYSVKVK